MKRLVTYCLLATLLLALAVEGTSAHVRHVPSKYYKSIQTALDAAGPGDTVLVSPGVYKENLLMATPVCLMSTEGPARTIIDANHQGIGLKCQMIDSTATIRGFTFRNGVGLHGGGVFLNTSSASIIGNVFTADSAKYGGGVCALWSNSIIKDNKFRRNKAAYGGALYTMFISPQIDSNIVEDNEATIGGGFYFARSSEATVRGNVIQGNRAERGGAVFMNTAAPSLEQNLLRANSAEEGGAISSLRSIGVIRENILWENKGARGAAIALADTVAPDIERNTIVFNSAPDSVCAGLYASTVFARVVNNIFAYNSPGYAVYCVEGSMPVFSCNILWGNDTGNYEGVVSQTADIYEDPLFCAPKKGDFSVQEDSPALGGSCGTIGARSEGCEGSR